MFLLTPTFSDHQLLDVDLMNQINIDDDDDDGIEYVGTGHKHDDEIQYVGTSKQVFVTNNPSIAGQSSSYVFKTHTNLLRLTSFLQWKSARHL